MINQARRITSAVAVALALALPLRPAFADVSFTVRGDTATLHSNRLTQGDAARFEDFLNEPRASAVRVIYLDSNGGDTQTAIAIGRDIRAHGLATAFQPGRARCVSACTTMFLGGAARYYVGGSSIHDGAGTRKGLGFHPSSGGAPGEESILDYYREMGVDGATAWRYKIFSREQAESAPGQIFRPMFFVGGRSAVESGVATSLGRPGG